jgi:hypothetical protein
MHPAPPRPLPTGARPAARRCTRLGAPGRTTPAAARSHRRPFKRPRGPRRSLPAPQRPRPSPSRPRGLLSPPGRSRAHSGRGRREPARATPGPPRPPSALLRGSQPSRPARAAPDGPQHRRRCRRLDHDAGRRRRRSAPAAGRRGRSGRRRAQRLLDRGPGHVLRRQPAGAAAAARRTPKRESSRRRRHARARGLACSRLLPSRPTPLASPPAQGSCHYGTNIPELYAAWPDTLDGFEGSCGRCLEVACRNVDFHDGYGAVQQRSGACYDETRSIVVKIVDRCAGSAHAALACSPQHAAPCLAACMGRSHAGARLPCRRPFQPHVLSPPCRRSCPCHHANAYSNARWCCGDMK